VFQIVKHRYWYFLLSALVLVPGAVSFLLYGVPRSIDFTGGALYEVQFESPDAVSEADIRAVYADSGVGEVQVIEAVNDKVRHQIRSADVSPAQKDAISDGLAEAIGPYEELRFESIGPSVGALVTRNATIAVIMASMGILAYLTVQFRGVPHPVRYGVCAILAMLHDVLLVVGLASLAGLLFGWEIAALFITALLTIIGFSVHDSIVVFDRIRENVGRMRGMTYEDVVNHSVIQTLDRSINTQLTAIFTLMAIHIYTEGSIKRFTLWLLIGFLAGTYSSIFNASQLLVVWENREWNRWFGRGRREATAG